MANRTAAKIFSDLFKTCFEIDDRRVSWEMYRKIKNYDFEPCQMSCEKELVELGLADWFESEVFTGGKGIIFRDPETMEYEEAI